MKIRTILSYGLMIGLIVPALSTGVFAEEPVTDSEVTEAIEEAEQILRETDAVLEEEGVEEAQAEEIIEVEEEGGVCGFDLPSEKYYDASVISVRRKLAVALGEEVEVKVFLQNNGSMPWFSNNSSCFGPKMSLGTSRTQDRISSLYPGDLSEDSNWESASRIGMDQERVDVGEIASFTFTAIAPDNTDILKEYFTPVLKGIEWIDEAEFSFELIVGELDETPVDLRKKLLYQVNSGSAININLDGEKSFVVDLSEQKLWLKLDDETIAELPTSTGAPSTPTPVGTYEIELKQDVRVGHAAPHYVMPKFMWFRAGGYGFHALPSLGTDGGVFWTEARNHIGTPVSHGCIRLLPEDADFAFEFADIGTPVYIQY